MCPPSEQIKNIFISGVVDVANPTIKKVISLPFDPKLMEVTRMHAYATVGVGEDAVYTITSSIIPDIIASFSVYSDDQLETHQNLNIELHDVFSIPTLTQGEINFEFNTSSGLGFPPGSEIKFGMNLRFSR